MWVEKYRPRKIEEMVGNEDARAAALLWLKKWKPGSKALLLMGPPGTGKTTFVTLLAKSAGMNLIELNASDVRTKDRLEKRLGESIRTVSLLGERSLVFLDEVDGLLGRSDYGGVEFIKDAVKETSNPIIMAANDPDADEIRKLASSSIALAFRPPPPREVGLYLGRIAKTEGLSVDEGELEEIVRSTGGDLRHAINSLQSRGGPKDSSKDRSSSLTHAFTSFFEAKDEAAALAALRSVSLPPVEKVRELNRSIVRSGLPPEKLAGAMEVLSRADMLMGKIMKAQEWRLLRYLDSMLSRELFPVVRGMGLRYVSEDLPFPMLLRIWNDSKKVREISFRYARRSSTSGSSARSRDLPFVFALCSGKEFRQGLSATLDLDDSYEKFLVKEAGR